MAETTPNSVREFRNEILKRLGFQQQIINFTFILAGTTIPMLIYIRGNSSNYNHITAPLIGAFISLFLTLVYIKQHTKIAQLSNFIAEDNPLFCFLGKIPSER